MEYLEKALNLTRYNFKILLNINVAAAFAYILITPAVLSYRYLNFYDMAKIGENYCALVGIILFVYLGNFEDANDLNGITYTRSTKHINIFLLRLIMMTTLTVLLIGLPILFARLHGGNFDSTRILFGVLISALFLGMLGLTVSNITNNMVAGYMVSFGYYIFEFITKGKYTGDFYLMSLLKNSFSEKIHILWIIGAMIIINIIIEYKRS